MGDSWFNDLVTQAAKGLGIDSGENAAKTATKVIKDLSSSAPAANLPSAVVIPTGGLTKQQMTMIGVGIGGVVLYMLLKE